MANRSEMFPLQKIKEQSALCFLGRLASAADRLARQQSGREKNVTHLSPRRAIMALSLASVSAARVAETVPALRGNPSARGLSTSAQQLPN